MKKLVTFAVSCLTALIIVSFFSCTPKVPKANLKNEIDSLSYVYGIYFTQQGLAMHLEERGIEGPSMELFIKALLEGTRIKKDNKNAIAELEGRIIGKQLANDVFDNVNFDVFGGDSTYSMNKSQFLAGFIAGLKESDLLISKEDAEVYLNVKTTELQTKQNEKNKLEGQIFLAGNRDKEGVKLLPSGLQYKVEKEGSGPKPSATDKVKVKYRGTNTKGVEFDSRDEQVFFVNGVVDGWTEGLQLMSVGSKYVFYIPYELGYGEMGRLPYILPYSTLIFEIELLDIVKE